MKGATLSIRLAAAMLLGSGAFSFGFAQNSGNITAQANVLTPITVTAERNVDFANVFPGVSKAVVVNSLASGRLKASGASNGEVSLGFTLPANLTSGANTLPISFGATSAGRNTVNDPAAATLFDPAVGATARLGTTPSPTELFVWIGGTVTPASQQAAGLYTGTVTLTVNYTGN